MQISSEFQSQQAVKAMRERWKFEMWNITYKIVELNLSYVFVSNVTTSTQLSLAI